MLKNILAIIAVLAFTLSVAACRDNGPKTDEARTPETVQATPEPSPDESTEATLEPGAEAESKSEPKVVKYDFRRATWGTSMEEVLAIEKIKPKLRGEDTLVYQSTAAGMPALVDYKFVDDKLYRGGLVFNEVLKDNNQYIESYNKVKQVLLDANRPAAIDVERQINPDAVIDPDNKGDAVCRGDMIYGAEWTKADRTVVRVVLNGVDSRCFLSVVYASPEMVRELRGQNGTAR